MTSVALYAAVVVRISDGVELCCAPGAKLPEGRNFPHAVMNDVVQQYCQVPDFCVSDTRSFEGDTLSFHVMTEAELGFVLMAEKSLSRARGHEALTEVAQLFHRMFVESASRLTNESTLTFVMPAHDLLLRLGAAPAAHDTGIRKVKQEIEEVKTIALDNVNRAVQRGAKLDDIMEATDDLQFQAQGFHQNSRNLYNQIWWNSMKGKMMLGGVATIFVLFILFTFFY